MAEETTKLTHSKPVFKLPWVVLVLCSYTDMQTGLAVSLIGTTLPELQIKFHSSLKVVSGFFLAFCCSAAIGNLSGHVFLKFCDTYLLIAAVRLINGIALVLVVMTPHAAIAFVLFALTGLCVGVGGNVVFSLCNVRFPDKPYVFHVLSMSMSFGAFICPLIAAPFVRDNPQTSQCAHNGSIQDLSPNVSSFRHHCDQEPSDSAASLKYIYIIIALITLPSTVGFTVHYLKDKCFGDSSKSPNTPDSTNPGGKDRGPRLVFLILILLIFFSSIAVAFVHGSYMTTVAEKGHLKLSARKTTGHVSVFWFMLFLGRVLGIAASTFMKQVIVLWICVLGSVISILLLIVSVYQPWEIYYLAGSYLLGMFAGPQYAALMTWSKQHLTLTSFIIGLYDVLTFAGCTVLSFAGGQLIASFGEVSEPYLCLGFEVFKILTLCVAQAVSKSMSLQ